MQTGTARDDAGNPIEEFNSANAGLAGDPNCPYCAGLGYLRRDLPLGHPDFGKLEPCSCRHAKISDQVHKRLFALSNLHQLSNLTFENFNPRGHIGLYRYQVESLERAYSQAQYFAQHLNGWLVLLGGYGCGKTHLAAAIANFAVGMGVPTLFITVPDLLDSLRFSYQDGETTFEQRFEEIRTASLLVLDDFGTQNATAWAQEKLFQIINYRYINRLPVVVTSNLELRDIEGRIRSRLEDPELSIILDIKAPDYRRPSGESGNYELATYGFLSRCTFDTFDLRKKEALKPEEQQSLERAFKAAQEFARNPEGWMVFMGTYGCGKTHLAAAIANYQAEHGRPPLFVVVPDLLDHLRATFSPNSTVTLDRRFEQVRSAPLLILDDLGTQATSAWAREKLYQLFNHRYNSELPTVITTANFPDEMDPRLRSRMEDTHLCTICAITAPAYRGASQKPARSTRRKRT